MMKDREKKYIQATKAMSMSAAVIAAAAVAGTGAHFAGATIAFKILRAVGCGAVGTFVISWLYAIYYGK